MFKFDLFFYLFMTEDNIVIIGSGIVGLAIAYELSSKYEKVILLEKLQRVGDATSSRNSGVIHAGIYYPKDSLKSRLCIEGNRLLYEFAQRYDITHKKTGKVIVASSDEESEDLARLELRARSNGVDLYFVDKEELKSLEPNVDCVAALYSPNTGIINQTELADRLRQLFQDNSGIILTNTCVIGAEQRGRLFDIQTNIRGSLEARLVINSAGLYADDIARMLGCDEYAVFPCRGEYFELTPKRSNVVNGLVYPVRKQGSAGLGVHFTKNTAGIVLIGPNAVYVSSKEDYETNRASIESFFESARILVPSLKIEDMRPSYAGIRSKLVRQGEPDADFIIINNKPFPNVIHLLGIESPGLTACLSIGKHVRIMIDDILK